MGRKLTVKDLIAKKAAIEQGKRKSARLYVKSLDGEVTITAPTREMVVDALNMEPAGAGDKYIVYHCVVEPNLKDPELQREFGCLQPDDIVEKVFLPGEIASISRECGALAGYGEGSVKMVEELKN